MTDAQLLFEAVGLVDEKLLAESDREERPTAKRMWTRVLIAAIVAALLAAAAWAAYVKWSLPEPTPYENPDKGIYDVHSQTDYSAGELLPKESQEPLTDQYFIREAEALLEVLGLEDVSAESFSVTRKTNQKYGREEAEVSFTKDENNTGVTYSAETGELLKLSSIDWIESSTAQGDGEAMAREYYKRLPVKQGYTLKEHYEYDEQYWSFDFCREVLPGVYSSYECVRIAVNPQSGRLAGVYVFSFPLLDDHEEGDEPLAQAAAEAIAAGLEGVSVEDYTLKSANIEVVLPNWMFTEYMGANLQYSKVSRLAWRLTYENTSGVVTDIVYVDIDLYTGELLGGDATG